MGFLQLILATGKNHRPAHPHEGARFKINPMLVEREVSNDELALPHLGKNHIVDVLIVLLEIHTSGVVAAILDGGFDGQLEFP